MLKHRRSLFVLILLPVSLLSALLFLLFQAAGKASEAEYTDCVVGLLPNKTAGSDLVIYPTETWDPVTILTLPDVTPDNDAAVSEDGRRIAYTTWDEGYIRRYLKVLDTSTGETHSFYRDTPPKTEVIDLSWMPDHKTLLCVVMMLHSFLQRDPAAGCGEWYRGDAGQGRGLEDWNICGGW